MLYRRRGRDLLKCTEEQVSSDMRMLTNVSTQTVHFDSIIEEIGRQDLSSLFGTRNCTQKVTNSDAKLFAVKKG